MRNPDQDFCYMCRAKATSKEHVPPKCIFPEGKDMDGGDYRKHLVTVPSCEKHNSQKSKDDEFLMVSLAGIFGNNSIGYMHKFGKVDRAIRRSSKRLLDKVFIKKKHYLFEADNNKFYEVIWGTPDQGRLEKCFEHISYGIHYHHFGTRFSGKMKILLGYLHHEDQNPKNFISFIKDRASIDRDGVPKNGENQDVFYYQFTEPDQFGFYLVKLVFYGGIEAYVSYLPDDRDMPVHLGMELIKQGIPTVLTLGDKTYDFNKS